VDRITTAGWSTDAGWFATAGCFIIAGRDFNEPSFAGFVARKNAMHPAIGMAECTALLNPNLPLGG